MAFERLLRKECPTTNDHVVLLLDDDLNVENSMKVMMMMMFDCYVETMMLMIFHRSVDCVMM